MKQLLFIPVVLACVCLSFTKEKPFIPPGTVQINDTLFADETEITNVSWREYERWVSLKYGANSKEHIATLPDTLCWRDKFTYNEPYVQHYYRHPAYKEYPVVGISYEQAIAFCKWRTERVKSFLTLAKKHKYRDFEYRLPTKNEWEKLAEFSMNVLYNNGKNEKGNYLLNCAHPDSIVVNGTPIDNADVTAPVYSYWKNLFGLYNMLGNVAEMVNEKGISKGGGWRNRLEECRVGKDMEYTKPTAWLGFRSVCVVKKVNS
ncbi:MAG: SUMF1/EgtB/PvdO family nonheme iron enzyme [Bacteroidota bacterium]